MTTKTIGQRIKEARAARGWTRKELATRMGYKSEITIWRLETGKHTHEKPSSRVLMALERALRTKLVK